MNCPVCGKEMEQGWLQAGEPMGWSRKRIPTLAIKIMVSDQELGLSVSAYRCTPCKKLIVNYGEEK